MLYVLFCTVCRPTPNLGPLKVAEAPTSHRERKKLATRKAIHDAAFDLVERNGLSATTIEAISERAGIAPRTFWAYFASKEDAVIDRDPESPDRLRAALLSRPPEEAPLSALRRVLESYMARRGDDSDRAIRRQQVIRREPPLMATVAAVYDEVERALVSALGDRMGLDPSIDLRPGVLVAAACGTCRIAQQRWADQNGRIPFPLLAEEAFTNLAECVTPILAGSLEGRSR